MAGRPANLWICPATMEAIIRTARDERLFPGEGTIEIRGILDCLPDNIPLSLEIPRVALTKAVGPEEVARLAIRVAQNHLDDRPTRASAKSTSTVVGVYAANGRP